MPDSATPCPGCGVPETRVLTRQELKDRSGGRDPLVVVRPRVCRSCGHVWEPPPSRSVCWLVAAVAAVAWLIGVVIVLGAIGVLIALVFVDAGPNNTLATRGKIAGCGLLGLPLGGGGYAMLRKYVALARRRDGTRAPGR